MGAQDKASLFIGVVYPHEGPLTAVTYDRGGAELHLKVYSGVLELSGVLVPLTNPAKALGG